MAYSAVEAGVGAFVRGAPFAEKRNEARTPESPCCLGLGQEDRSTRSPYPFFGGYSRPPFCWLQRAQSSCRFSGVFAPPIENGMMWSYWMSKSLPHSMHSPTSRWNTASFYVSRDGLPLPYRGRVGCRQECVRMLELALLLTLAREQQRLDVSAVVIVVVGPEELVAVPPEVPVAMRAHGNRVAGLEVTLPVVLLRREPDRWRAGAHEPEALAKENAAAVRNHTSVAVLPQLLSRDRRLPRAPNRYLRRLPLKQCAPDGL